MGESESRDQAGHVASKILKTRQVAPKDGSLEPVEENHELIA